MLQIALQDGFENDTVVIRVDGSEVFRRDGVTTRTQLSLAESIEVEPEQATARVEVRLPDRDAGETVEVDLEACNFLGISIAPDGSFSFRKLKDVPGFL